jgi:hypothetical protein
VPSYTRLGPAPKLHGNFCQNRRDKYPGYKFCSNCDMQDASISCSLVSSGIRRTSYTFKCKSNHNSFVFSTDTISTKGKKDSPIITFKGCSSDECSTSDEESDGDPDSSNFSELHIENSVQQRNLNIITHKMNWCVLSFERFKSTVN